MAGRDRARMVKRGGYELQGSCKGESDRWGRGRSWSVLLLSFGSSRTPTWPSSDALDAAP
eukprot:97414-Hanusia_phi.AAC.1